MKSTIHLGSSRRWLGAGLSLGASVAKLAQPKSVTGMVAMLFMGAAVCANAQLLNGTLDTTFYGSPLYVQTINTQFGDSSGNDGSGGSELDAVYAKVSGGNLYLFIAGTLQNGGNHVNVFVAGGAAGQNILAAPSTATLHNMNGSIFPPGFQATWAYDVNDYAGTMYSEEYSLTGTPAGGYVGALASTSTGIYAGSDGGVASLYINNNLASTMGTASYPLSGATVGANVTTGFEIVVPTSAIGYTGGAINVLVDVNGGGDGYLSNQFLPGLDVLTAITSVGVRTNNLGTAVFNLGAAPTPTNYVTFSVDMTAQVLANNFTNDNANLLGDPNGSITVAGNFEGAILGGGHLSWDNGVQLTNNPAAVGEATNIFFATVPILAVRPDALQFKFRMSGGWESLAASTPQIGGNRIATITNTPTVLPLVYYSDSFPADLLGAPITVQFTVFVPPASVDINSYTFNISPGNDTLWISGDFLNNWNNDIWPGPLSQFPAAQQMMPDTSRPGVYTNYLVVPAGNSYTLTYKYSIDSTDDENGFNTNHVRVIRSTGPTYNMPPDVWSWDVIQPGNGTPYPNPGLSSTNIVEPDFGNLAAGAPATNHVPITWLGRPAVLLQKSSDLSSWTDITATDGLMATNWPNAGGNQFFRLKKH